VSAAEFKTSMDSPPDVSLPRLASFVRQLTHDVRNHLNGLDLEAALLTDLVADDEAKASVARLRQQIRRASSELRALSAKFSPTAPAISTIPAQDAFAIWKDQAAALEPLPRVEWHESVGDARLNVDLDMLARAFRELLANAVQFGTGEVLKAEARTTQGRVEFTLTEPKPSAIDCAEWGSPLISARRGSYGLGLWTVQRDAVASGGTVERHYDPEGKALRTMLAFPSA
jgi:signal transduction histidine kinase